MRTVLIAAAVLLAITACTKEQAKDELGAVNKANEAAAAASAHANVAVVDPIGVDECDGYLEKYEACLTGKVPAQQQQVYRAQLEGQRREWRAAAADPMRRDALPQQCKEAGTAAKETFATFGCEF
jgi:hypothetical protein